MHALTPPARFGGVVASGLRDVTHDPGRRGPERGDWMSSLDRAAYVDGVRHRE